jgi:hypothetical protein
MIIVTNCHRPLQTLSDPDPIYPKWIWYIVKSFDEKTGDFIVVCGNLEGDVVLNWKDITEIGVFCLDPDETARYLEAKREATLS